MKAGPVTLKEIHEFAEDETLLRSVPVSSSSYGKTLQALARLAIIELRYSQGRAFDADTIKAKVEFESLRDEVFSSKDWLGRSRAG